MSNVSMRDFRSIVMHANYYQFYRNERAGFPNVQSRMFLWCKTGRGCVTVNGRNFELATGASLLTPWDHAIRYEADPKDPFLVGGIHIIPDHACGKPIIFDIAHFSTHPLYQHPDRKNVSFPGLDGIPFVILPLSHPVLHLSDFIVTRNIQRPWTEMDARLAARLLLHELRLAFVQTLPKNNECPVELQQMIQFIGNHQKLPVSLTDLVHFSGLSPSTVERLFQKYFHCTPVCYIARNKIRAAEQLLRTTRTPVAGVGRAIGVKDPFYFSKLYKRVTGRTPSADRHKAKLI